MRRDAPWSWLTRLAACLAVCALAGCAALSPRPVALPQRLASFGGDAPVERPVEIRWDAHQIPYVTAATAHDAAFALGAIQAHLRGGELALAKAVVRGRLSEMGGPGLNDIDHALRILDFGKAAEAAIAAMPPETRAWLQAFVDGVNWFEARSGRHFPEAGLLGLEREPYTAADMIAIGRLGGMDVNWPIYRDLAALWGTPAFEAAYRRLAAAGADGPPHVPLAHDRFEALLELFARRGSNAFAVAPRRSATGGALFAADPHLSLALPGVWIAAGVRSPDFTAVGLMPLGVPVIAIGRNARLAWGGTNLHSATSDLYDVSALPARDIASRPTRIRTRFWFDDDRTIRETPYGPVISDAAVLDLPGRMLALRWAGHLATDEITAMLRIARAPTPRAFHDALASFGQPPQTMVFAFAGGHVGETFATTQSAHERFDAASFIRTPGDADASWGRLVTARDLPLIVDPPEGIVVSANDRPARAAAPLGFTFAGNGRARRIAELLQSRSRLSPADLMAIQRDTLSHEAARLARSLMAEIDALGLRAAAPALAARLDAWDGSYDAASTGAPAFETLLYHLLPALHGAASPATLSPIEAEWEMIVAHLAADLQALPAADRKRLLAGALKAAERDCAQLPDWGAMHRMPIAHHLAAIPLIGGFFDYGDYPAGGSRQTPMKTAHGLIDRPTPVDFGSSARFVADMSGPDETWLVLYGGQDGWLGSDTFRDQIDLWRAGRYIRMPLGDAAITKDFPVVTTLAPALTR